MTDAPPHQEAEGSGAGGATVLPSAAPEPGGAHSAASEATVGAVETKTVAGKKFIVAIALSFALVFVVNFFAARYNDWKSEQRRRDAAVLNDPSRVTQVWTMDAEGLTLVARPVDPKATGELKQIRRQLRYQRGQYVRADYSNTRFGANDIPGRADLEFGTTKLLVTCRYRSIEGGAELRWVTKDSVMLDSLAQWASNVGTSEVQGTIPTP